MLPPELLEILVCPRSKSPLLYFPRGEANDDEAKAFLVCPTSRLQYRVEAGVPAMLVEEATELSADAVARMEGRARELGIVPTGVRGLAVGAAHGGR